MRSSGPAPPRRSFISETSSLMAVRHNETHRRVITGQIMPMHVTLLVLTTPGMVSILILLRMLRIYRATLRARRAGQPATFRQLWREDGGLMGFITGLGAENTGIGAGGIADLVRVRRMLEERARILDGLGKVPAMWEVQVQQKGAQNAGKADSDRDGGSLGGDTPVQAYDVSVGDTQFGLSSRFRVE